MTKSIADTWGASLPGGSRSLNGRSGMASAGMDLRKITTPILVHLLRREMRSPTFFLLRCKLTAHRLKRNIDSRFPQELIDLAASPIVGLHQSEEKGRSTQAFEIMRIAILTGGVAQWNFAYRAAERERNFENLCDAEIEVNQTAEHERE